MDINFENRANQLIIIGNGFDKKCGLHSSYSEFFEHKYAKIDLNNINYQNLASDCNLIDSIWDLIFIYESRHSHFGLTIDNPQWQDVEQTISKWVNINTKDGPSMKDVYKYIANSSDGPEKQFSSFDNEEKSLLAALSTRICESYNFDKQSLFTELHAHHPFSVDDELNRKYINDADKHQFDDMLTNPTSRLPKIFLNELIRFENSFARYLSNDINDSYFQNAKLLYTSIANYSLPHHSYGFSPMTYILSFNYTTPLDSMRYKLNSKEHGDIWAIKNIHGTLPGTTNKYGDAAETSTIFGVDGFDHKGDRIPTIPRCFTKSSRQLYLPSQEVPIEDTRSLFDPLKSHVEYDAIKFYGHSLGSADYTYFKDIFNLIDIYHCHTILYFLYDHDYHTNPESIENLINRYNSEYRINDTMQCDLLHKLLIEDRIKLHEI